MLILLNFKSNALWSQFEILILEWDFGFEILECWFKINRIVNQI